MRVFKYWAKGSADVETNRGEWTLECFGGSNTSLEDAARRAVEKARRAAEAVRMGNEPDRYGYADRPLREEVVQEILQGDTPVAVITRNSHGSLVLNTANTMFVDIDYKSESSLVALKRFFGKLFGKRVPGQDEEILSRIAQTVESIHGFGVRVYRTASGYRCLVTSGTFDPRSSETIILLERFGSDPLYVKLCKVQECFRARLTPKCWRCGVPRPPTRFPWRDEEHEARYRAWEKSYLHRSKSYATCDFVTTFGTESARDTVREIVSIHDKFTCTGAGELA